MEDPFVTLVSTAAHTDNLLSIPYNTFDGPGFPACNAVSQAYRPSTVQEMVNIVENASSLGIPMRASGVRLCPACWFWVADFESRRSGDPNTIIIKTDAVNAIHDLELNDGVGTVVVEAGATFPQVAQWLKDRSLALGYTLVNWNITIAGAVAMGAHRSSLREDSRVPAAAVAMDIINGKGELVHLEKDQSNDTWLATTTSLGLLGLIARVQIAVFVDYKVYANQTTLDEEEALEGDMYTQISPFVTANYWASLRKLHLRMYGVVPNSQVGDAFQSTFSMTSLEGKAALALLNSGQNHSGPNFITEDIFYAIWTAPNFREKSLNLPLLSWPLPEWDYNLHGKTLELAVPIPLANQFFKRVRQLFDQAAAEGMPVIATYRSFLGQTTERVENITADWSKATMMFDFPSFVPTLGDHHRYNEAWYDLLAKTVIAEFPVRPHWTKNTRSVFAQALENLDSDARIHSLARFTAVRAKFDPNKIFKSVVGEIIGVVEGFDSSPMLVRT
ncbi:hypothetical protein DFH09DRAFT_1242778 [Mycena vulgaris]|nr:hypothetical protein DFH09DRAFT_1242778 [Mycena vulgaris]